MTKDELIKSYWNYYIVLEKKFLNTANYVEIDKRNYETFSIEYAHLLQSIGAELDNFFKEFCGFATTEKKNISNYATVILSTYPDIVNEKISVEDRDITLQPFKNWDVNRAAQSLSWWDDFDKIKHNRYGNIDKANLENVLNAMAALFLLESKKIKDIATDNEPDIPNVGSDLFSVIGWEYHYIPLGNGFAIIDGDVCQE